MTEGKPIPTELRKDEAELRKAIEFDDEKHESKLIVIALLMYKTLRTSEYDVLGSTLTRSNLKFGLISVFFLFVFFPSLWKEGGGRGGVLSVY